jgi:hypothetical protein
MESLYLIGTDWSAETLSEHFTKTSKTHGIPSSHIVLEVNLANRFGWLHKDAWEWISNAVANTTSLKPIRPPEI